MIKHDILCIVCIVELVVAIGGFISNWYGSIYFDPSTILILWLATLSFRFNAGYTVDVNLVLLNIVVDVAFIAFIDTVEFL